MFCALFNDSCVASLWLRCPCGQVALFNDALIIVLLTTSPFTPDFFLQKLRAKEFAVPQELRAMPYYDKAVGEGREVTQEGIALSPRVLQQAHEEQRKHFSSDLPLAESHAAKQYLTTELTATPVDRLERPQGLRGLEKELSSSQHLQATVGGPGEAGNPTQLAPARSTI